MSDDFAMRTAMSSEVFREFVRLKQAKDHKEALERPIRLMKEAEAEDAALEAALEDFDKLNDFLSEHPEYKEKFIKAKRKLQDNPELADKVDPDFVKGIYMLSLDDDDENMPDAMDRIKDMARNNNELDGEFGMVHPDAMDRLKAISAKILEESK
jgi:hypothetical protein